MVPIDATESALVAGTEQNDQYKTEFVRVYQDAGVVGVSMLTLLVLCLLLGLFCSRLIKMYITLTESRDSLENVRSSAIEKLSINIVLLRSETSNFITEQRNNMQQLEHKVTSLEKELQRGQLTRAQVVSKLDHVQRDLVLVKTTSDLVATTLIAAQGRNTTTGE